MIAKISVSRPNATHTLTQNIALCLLSETGLAAASKASGQSVWASVTEQAVGLQAEHPLNDGGKEKAFGEFIDAIRNDANKAYLVDMAHGLGLDRFTKGPENAKEKKDSGVVLLDRAMKKLDQYSARVNGAWALNILLTPGISTGKLEALKKEAKAQAEAKKEAEAGVPVHVQLRRSGESLAAATAAVSGEGNALDAGGMAVAARLVRNINRVLVAAALGNITIEQLDELATLTELVTEEADGEQDGSAEQEQGEAAEATELRPIPEGEEADEPQEATA